MAHAENRAGLMTRRQFLQAAGVGLGAVALAAFGSEAAPVAAAAKPAEARAAVAQVSPSQPLVTRDFPSTIDLRFAVPSSWAPEGDSRSAKNFLIPKGQGVEAPEGVYFHPKTDRDGVWAYDQSFGIRSNPRVVLRSHAGVEGQLWVRQGEAGQDTAIAVATLPTYTDSAGKVTNFNDGRFNDSFQIDTHCETEVWVINPDTGKPVEVNGSPLKGKTSDAGDLLFRVRDTQNPDVYGRIAIAYNIPPDIGNETFVEKASRDSKYKINEMDLRAHLVR